MNPADLVTDLEIIRRNIESLRLVGALAAYWDWDFDDNLIRARDCIDEAIARCRKEKLDGSPCGVEEKPK